MRRSRNSMKKKRKVTLGFIIELFFTAANRGSSCCEPLNNPANTPVNCTTKH